MASNFERKYGRYAIKNLTMYLIAGYIIGYVIAYLFPTIYSYLTFNPYMIFHGQIWRLFTWVVTMPESLSIFTIIMLFLYYSLGRSLEQTWGTYRYNVYLFSGFLFTIVVAIVLYFVLIFVYGADQSATLGYYISCFVSTYYINMSIFLAFAATYPDMQLMLYFIIPVKVKWFGLIYGAYILFDIIDAFRSYPMPIAITVTVMILASLLNFVIYFINGKVGRRYNPKQVKRRNSYRKSVRQAGNFTYENGARHKCAVCGRTELDDPGLTFRYCSKCSGNKEYCQEHLFTHTHQ